MSEQCDYCGWSDDAGVAHDCRKALYAEIERLKGELEESRSVAQECKETKMAKNKPCDVDELADEIVAIVGRLIASDGYEREDREEAGVEVSRKLRDELPAMWEWSSQESEIERLREENADLFNWRGRVTEALRQKMEISACRAVELIKELKAALLPFSVRHATMHKYYDSESNQPPADVRMPREWLRKANAALTDPISAELEG